ncbi:MAG: SAM-dependent chlorinase/fluorinase [Acidobacteria bacterium]|nr:SAM-dependent chlorinase/fluorinase [Acidobacteriota bacterium]
MVIALLTDFGTKDYFVGAMKGAILSINAKANIVDITHEIPPQDICSAMKRLILFVSNPPSQRKYPKTKLKRKLFTRIISAILLQILNIPICPKILC